MGEFIRRQMAMMLFAISLCAVSVQTTGQTLPKMGLDIGFGVSSVDDEESSTSMDINIVGITSLNHNLYLTYGGGLELLGIETSGDFRVNDFYLCAPVNIGYHVGINEAVSYFLQGGPKFKLKINGDFDGDKVFDIGAEVKTGVKIRHFIVGIGGEYGLLKYSSISHKSYINAFVGYTF